MKRIGIYLGFPPEGGGAFQYALTILEALSSLPRTNYEVIVAHSHNSWPSRISKYKGRFTLCEVNEGFCDIWVQKLLRFGLPLSLWRSLAPLFHNFTQNILSLQCDLWIFPTQDVWTYAIPTSNLGVIHDLMHRYEKRFPEVYALGLYHRRERHYRRMCSYAVALLSDSNLGKAHIIESYSIDSNNIHVLPYIAPAYMSELMEDADFDRRYNLPDKYIFYPAQFWQHKNHIHLLQAIAIARSEIPDLHLVLSGSKKNAYSNVLDEIHRLRLHDFVHILGYVPDEDMPVIYRRALALVMPTFFGPTNIPPLEAMVAGCPIAVSDIYAMREQLGDAALYFDPNSPTDIAQSILQLYKDENVRRQLVMSAKIRMANWSQIHFNQRLIDIIESVL